MTTKTLLLLCLAASLPMTLAHAEARRPNVIVILADDLGYADVGFNGCKDIPTPNIDRLAANGLRFANGYVSHPFCSPTRAGLMTGRYQQRFGHENNPAWLPQDPKIGLPVEQVALPGVLRDAGYATGAIGKWHLGAAPCFHPNERGFTEYFGFLGGGHNYLPGMKGNPEYTVSLVRNREPVEQHDYMTDELSREAASFIQRHKADPFFLYLAYNAVHTPLQAPDKYLARFPQIPDPRRRTYAAMNSAMDDGIGLVLQTLKANSLEEDTLVFFLSDNGGPAPEHAPTDNSPLRGYKGSVYEGGIHVPFVVQWRGHLKPGTVFTPPVISLDILPTALALAGAKPPVPLDGVNLMPHLLGQNPAPPHETLHWRTGGGACWAIRNGSQKLLQFANNPPQLFDLEQDLAEQNDIATQHPDTVARLRKLHETWNAELIPPLFESPKQGKAKKKAR